MSSLDLYAAPLTARLEITELRRQLHKQSLYIAELEKQLEYCNPGVVKEVQEFLEVKEGR